MEGRYTTHTHPIRRRVGKRVEDGCCGTCGSPTHTTIDHHQAIREKKEKAHA